MLKDINPLPGPQRQSSASDWHRLTRPGQGHLQMARRVIRSLGCMDQARMILGHEILEVAMQIGTCRRIGILVDHETRARVTDKNRGKPRADPAGPQEGIHLRGDLVGPLTPRGDIETFGDGFHDFRNEGREYPRLPIRPSVGARRSG
jgi:hypothetical protein